MQMQGGGVYVSPGMLLTFSSLPHLALVLLRGLSGPGARTAAAPIRCEPAWRGWLSGEWKRARNRRGGAPLLQTDRDLQRREVLLLQSRCPALRQDAHSHCEANGCGAGLLWSIDRRLSASPL